MKTFRCTRGLSLLALALALGGCVSATIEEVRTAPALFEAPQEGSIVILGRRHNNGYETESNFVDCVGKSLRSSAVLPEEAFIDSLYPWFEPRTAPLDTADLPALLANEAVAKRIEGLGVRYMIWVDGATNTTDQAGSMTCTISPGGGGCFGFVTWARDSSYEATVWDLETQQTLGRISSDANGTSYMPAMIVPVPIIARVQAQACSGLADQLETFLSGPVTENAG